MWLTGVRRLRLCLVCIFTNFCAMSGALAQADILLGPGDAISFSVIGAPELSIVSMIGPNGQMQLPAAGWVKASGLTIQELRTDIENAVSNRPFRLSSGVPGEETWRRVSPNELLIDVATYRPIYLTGDVRAGGQLDFRPGLTLRQAVAQVGGLGISFETDISPLQLVQLSSSRDILRGEIDFAQTTLDRLEKDLATIGQRAPTPFRPTPPGDRTEAVADRWLEARDAERQLTENSTTLRLEQMANRLDVLGQMQDTNTQNLEIERGLLDRARTLVERGVAPTSTLVDARRGLLQMTMQELETSGEMFRLKLDMARTRDEIRRLQSAQRVALLERVAALQADLTTKHQRLSALDARIALLGGQMLISPADPSYRFEIHRAGDATSIVSDQLSDLLLQPGDVVTVTLQQTGPAQTDAELRGQAPFVQPASMSKTTFASEH